VQGYGVYLASFFSSVVCFFRQLQPTITTPKTSVFIEFSLISTECNIGTGIFRPNTKSRHINFCTSLDFVGVKIRRKGIETLRKELMNLQKGAILLNCRFSPVQNPHFTLDHSIVLDLRGMIFHNLCEFGEDGVEHRANFIGKIFRLRDFYHENQLSVRIQVNNSATAFAPTPLESLEIRSPWSHCFPNITVARSGLRFILKTAEFSVMGPSGSPAASQPSSLSFRFFGM
jgi:hypothetical protein